MYLIIDYREQRSGIVELIENLPDIHFRLENIECGDYVVDEKIIFERKTLPDFLSSIKNGRFFRQSYKMSNRDKPYIIILEGTKESVKNTGMKREAIQGALVHIAVFLGIPVLRSVDIKETLQLMVQAAKQMNDYKENFQYKVYNKGAKMKRSNAEKLKLQVIQNLPGIGHERAKAIIKEFGTLNKVFSTDVNNLLKVEGIGKKTAGEIVKLIN